MAGGLSEYWDVVAKMHNRVRVSGRPTHTVGDAEALNRVAGGGERSWMVQMSIEVSKRMGGVASCSGTLICVVDTLRLVFSTLADGGQIGKLRIDTQSHHHEGAGTFNNDRTHTGWVAVMQRKMGPGKG
jgi:hypothetical protein